MPQPIPDGITRQHVLVAIERLQAGTSHDFHDSTRWDLEYDGSLFPPKAIIGLAAEAAFGQRLAPRDFSSGERPKQAVGYLRALGFKLRRKDGR